ncbi:hypothetical protein V2J09_022675 [Rumex salicifolius]
MKMEAEDGGSKGGAYVVWEDVGVLLPVGPGPSGKVHGPTRRLLNGLYGYAQPGRIMALMGPSASGKSTLLDCLADRLSANVVMTGKIFLNGKRQKLSYGGVRYVAQENTLLGTLTVRETLTYSAHLRLPPTLTKDEIKAIVDGNIPDMGLQECSDRLIGNWHLRGISNGEKKRLSIAVEILTCPRVLLLDEPTTGLDSAASFFVVHILKAMALDHRTTVVASIHQPSSETFALFDDLFLLSRGEAVYFGEANEAVRFFAEAGFPCPITRNPSDHFLTCINSDFDRPTTTMEGTSNERRRQQAEIESTLIEKYKWSEYAMRVRLRIQEISSMDESGIVGLKRGSQPKWWKQLTTLTKRSSVNMSRDMGYYWARIAIYILLSISVGELFYDVGNSYSAILARVSCIGFVFGYMMTLSIGGFPSFIEEMKVFNKERQSGHYGVAVYILSNYISSFPYLVAVALTTGSISFYMVKFGKEFSHFAFYCLCILGCISAVESCLMVVASLVPNYLMGIVIGAGILGIMNMASGFFRLISDLPKVFWRYPMSYISFPAWAVQGLYKNDLIGLEFEPLLPGDPKLRGSVIITTMFGIRVDHSKWWDLAAIYIIVLFYRILFFFVIKLKERATPVFKLLYAKKIIRQLKKRASFRKSAFPSKRLQPSHPLHEQEGLNSPTFA